MSGFAGAEGLRAQDRGAPRFGPATPGDTIRAEASDAGRLWSVATPPFDRFQRRYGIDPDSAWVAHLRRSVLRLPHCSGALVSARGLVLTSARCVRQHRGAPGAEQGVLASASSEERSLSGLHADRLVQARNVTGAVETAQEGPERSLRQARQVVQERLQSEASQGHRVEVVSAPGGTQHTAYTYRRYDDLRMVFLPSRAVSEFGGVEAALTYPRYAFDVALLRVYTDDGTPLMPDHHLDPPTQERQPGDPVFGIGFADRTRRAESADQLAFRRDVVLSRRSALLEDWTRALQTYLDTAAASPRWERALVEGRHVLKRVRAQREALQHEYVKTRVRERDAQVRRLQKAPSTRPLEGVLDSLAALQQDKRALAPAYRAFKPLEAGPYGSSTLRRALLVRRASQVGPGRRDTLLQRATMVREQPKALDAAMMAAHLEAIEAYLRPDTAAVRSLLRGRTPMGRATSVVEASALAHRDSLRREGPPALEAFTEDPAVRLVEAFGEKYRSFREAWDALARSEQRLTRQLAQGRAAVQKSPVLPAAGRAPRLTDGRLLGYPYNGTIAPPFTTFFGLYSHAGAFGGEAPWTLPEKWRAPDRALDRSVPLNIAVSTDLAATPPGTPLVNQYLEVIGLAIGTNIQGAAGEYIYLPERMRTVGVDLRALRESLASVYGASSLIEELFGGGSDADASSR